MHILIRSTEVACLDTAATKIYERLYSAEHVIIKHFEDFWLMPLLKESTIFFSHCLGWRGNINFLYNWCDASLGLENKSYSVCISLLQS